MLQRGLIDIIVLALLWGPSFLFNKIALIDMQPLTLVSLRMIIGALFLGIILKQRRLHYVLSAPLLRQGFMLGLLSNGLPFTCFCYCVLYIPTSLAALINGTMPVMSIILARIFLGERLTLNKVMGVLLGVLGFLVLFVPSLLDTDASYNPVGMGLSFVGALSYAIAVIYARKRVAHTHPLVLAVLQLLTSVIYLVPLAFYFELPFTAIRAASPATWGAVLGLSILGTGLAFLMYYRILLKQGVAALSVTSYLLPIIGTALGVVFLNESPQLCFLIATLCILAGVVLVNRQV